jgi:restriction system protein
MSRRHGFIATLNRMSREAARLEHIRQRERAHQAATHARDLRRQEQQLLAADRQARQMEQLTARQVKQNAANAARLHLEMQIDEAKQLSQLAAQQEELAGSLLVRALSKQPGQDASCVRRTFRPKRFDISAWATPLGPTPRWEDYIPQKPGMLASLVPGASSKYERKLQNAKDKFEADNRDLALKVSVQDQERKAALESFEEAQDAKRHEIEEHNAGVEALENDIKQNDYTAVIGFYELLLDNNLSEECDANSCDVGYSTESKHLVVDLNLPDFSAIPEFLAYKYVKSADRIDPVNRPIAQRKTQYSNLICQIALKCLYVIFSGGKSNAIECVTVNGMLSTIDPATGKNVKICLLSVRVTESAFSELNLSNVQPESCLRSLKAAVSKGPAELIPVRPIVELNMVDPRFIETMNVMSQLDTRPNLMDLTPNEFEGLITNLFAAMGLDTRQTRASRDGGVDCVAFDPRPIFGGKVVIQAKRYKNTVGVSAVRDLFGTVQNEGASKGILVTTSGYGKAAFEFASGKPLELLDGANLLFLLSEHANIDARIIMPDDWVDIHPHGE